jgi:hypothetical protein
MATAGVLDYRFGQRGATGGFEQANESISDMPNPPAASGASNPMTPISPSCCHMPGIRPMSFSHAARTASGLHSFAKKSRTAVAEQQLDLR